MSKAELAKELYEMIYKATTTTMTNFGGSFGIYSGQEPLASDLMKSTGQLLGGLKQGRLADGVFDEYLAKCRIAEASNIISPKSVDRIHEIIDELRKEK